MLKSKKKKYLEKYLKYKSKYIYLLNHSGGGCDIEKYQTAFDDIYKIIKDELIKLLLISDNHTGNFDITLNGSIYKISKIFNEENFKKYIEYNYNINNKLGKLLIELFNNTKYISFNTFLSKFKNLFDTIIDYIEKNSDKCFILVIPSENPINIDKDINTILEKSNFFLSMVFYHYYKEYSKTISNLYVTFGPNYHNLTFFNDKKVVFLLIDDCSYSGRQIVTNIKSINSVSTRMQFPHNIIVILPYISQIALRLIEEEYSDVNVFNIKLNKLNKINILYNEMIKNYIDFSNYYNTLINNDLIFKIKVDESKYLITSLFEIYKISFNNYPIIFQHKLADSISIYNALYEYGIIFNNIINIYEIKQEINSNPVYSYFRYIEKYIDWIKFYENTNQVKYLEPFDEDHFEDFMILGDLTDHVNTITINQELYNYPDYLKIFDIQINDTDEGILVSKINDFRKTKGTFTEDSVFLKKIYLKLFISLNTNNQITDKIKLLYC